MKAHTFPALFVGGLFIWLVAAPSSDAVELIDLTVKLEDVAAVPLSIAVTDPILYKSWLALKMSLAANSSSFTCPTEVVCSKNATLSYQNTTVVLASTPTYHLVVAFSSSDPALSQPINGTSDLTGIPFADVIVDGNKAGKAHAKTFEAFRTGSGVKQGKSLLDTVTSWNLATNNGTPVNVLVTGIGAGATLAPITALYLAVMYPVAHITLITFGAPSWPLNNKANWTLTQLTDLYYLYPESLAAYPELESAKLNDIYNLKDNFLRQSVFQGKLAEDLLRLLKDAQKVQILEPNGTDVSSYLLPTAPINDTSTLIIDANKTADYGPARLNETIAVWESVKNECTPIFCKIRFPSVLQALIYEEYYPETPDVHGPVRIGEVFDEYGPIQLVLTAGRDADGAVGWVPDRETAYFIFRGSESDRDWQADANALQAYYQTGSPAQSAVFLDPQAHAGVYRQFQKLTFKPDKPEDDFAVVFANISDNAQPRVIVCTGQSLGGGLSHMCGPWASNTWPNASVFVVNEGSLKPGDAHFKDFFNIIVGNAYRMVNGKDQVPLLAPTSNFDHVFRGWWLDNSTTAGPILRAGERDPLKLLDANWVDHSYYTYSLLQLTINNATAPDWVQQLDNSSFFESYKGAAPSFRLLGAQSPVAVVLAALNLLLCFLLL